MKLGLLIDFSARIKIYQTNSSIMQICSDLIRINVHNLTLSEVN